MLAACRVPQKILDEISTAGLVETVLSYPMLGDMMVYNSPQQGYDAISGRFTGFTELFTREDAGTELLLRYLFSDPVAYDPDWESAEIGHYKISFSQIETILCQEVSCPGFPSSSAAT